MCLYIGNFCTDLTTLTYNDVMGKPPLEGVLGDLRRWTKDYKFDIRSMPWGSWGDYDRVQFFRECARKKLEYPFGRAHYSLKGLYSMLTGQGRGYGMAKALKQQGIDFEGTQHRGIDDAKNAAELFIHMLKKTR